jgi:hypothetical protein
MEVVNRRSYFAAGQEFPCVLFLVMWLNAFAITLILLPILRGRGTRGHEPKNRHATPPNPLLTHPNSTLAITLLLMLVPVAIGLLNSLRWQPLNRLFNGPNPEQPYFPGMILALGLFLFPIAAGVIARGPIVLSLRTGGGLFAHPVHLVLVVLIVGALGYGLAELIVDQLPCFLGIPNCD